MPRRVFRVCRSIYARLDGEGARRAGGRWNSPGRRVVYMADSVALAVLENLVHMNRVDFPRGYVIATAWMPDTVHILSEHEWRKSQGDRGTVSLGDEWIRSGASPVLCVRSVIVPSECNYLLNPEHAGFKDIIAEMPVPFEFDERLFAHRTGPS